MSCAIQHVEEIHNVLSVMQKNLECPICLDLMKEPVTTRCDHIFCRFCMFQLLGRKKKGRAQCPMCKKEVTKRSLQESPRFKLLIDGLMKIISAFEQDSGYKFFASLDHAKNIFTICKENKEEQTVVQSKGYRKRKRTVNGEQCEEHTTILETSIDALLTRDGETESCGRFKRKKQETHDDKSKGLLITDFESDYSEDDLFKKAGSLGNDCGRSDLLAELGKDDDDKSQDEDLKIYENISLNPEMDDVVASDLAEYGFSERDLESTRSNLLCTEGERAVKKTAKKRYSSEAQGSSVLDGEQSLLGDCAGDTVHSKQNDQAGSTIQLKKHVDERRTLKIAIDNQYDKDDSVPEEMTSTQSSPRHMSNAVPRKRMKGSIQRVNEWLQKTSEFFNVAPWDEELLSEVFPELDEDVSDKDSYSSGETELMTTFYPNAEFDAVEKVTNVQDKIFGKVYKREKKSNSVPKITVVASVHVDSVVDSRKMNEIPKRLTSGLQPEDFIRRVETTDISYLDDDGDKLTANDIVLNNKNDSNQDSENLNNDKSSNAQRTKLRTQAKSIHRKSESALSTQIRKPLSLMKSSYLDMDKQSPSNCSDLKIDTYPSSNELGHEDNQRNVRRSSRLNLLSKKVENTEFGSPNHKPTGPSDKKNKNIDPDCVHPITETVFQKQLCTTFDVSEDQITTMLTPTGKIAPAHPERQTSDGIKEDQIIQAEAEKNVLRVDDIDSDADTQHLIKAFKSTKRMSFKLDQIAEMDNKGQFSAINLYDTKANLPSRIAVSEKQEQVIHTSDILSNGNQEKISGESDVLVLCSENETTSKYPIIAQSSSPVRREHTRSVTIQGENEQVKKDFYRKHSFYEEQVNQITSDNSSQGSVTEKLEHSLSHHSSPLKSPEINSDTPDGLLCIAERPIEEHSFCAEAEKSFVFAKVQKVGGPKSPVNASQIIKRKKRRAQKLESSEEESSEDEELPCFNTFLFGNASNSAGPKNALSDCSPKQQGGGGLAMFSSYSTSGKTQTSVNFPKEMLGSQDSMNLFSSQSNTSDHSTNVAIDQELKNSQSEHHEKSSKRKSDPVSSNGQLQEDYEIADNLYEDPSKEQKLDDVSECESEASHTGDSSGLSSQYDVFNTQQQDALRNNLEKLQEEMAALEAVLEQHSTPSPSSEKDQASIAEPNTMRLQEAYQKLTDHEGAKAEVSQRGSQRSHCEDRSEASREGAIKSPDSVPETEMPSLRSVEPPVPCVIGIVSATPPPSPSQTKSKKETPEKVRSTFRLLKALKESTFTQEESSRMEQSTECSSSSHKPDTCKPPEANLNQAPGSPRRSLRSRTQSNGALNKISTPKINAAEAKQQSQQKKTNVGSIKRGSSPTFTSPTRNRRGSMSSKIPVIPNRRNFSLVASGLSQNELMLVQKFARKTQSILSGEMSESTTHVVIKTDEYLVCERTLKYFLGIAGRKWVVSYDWIVQSFREGRILDEYDFEVKGDVINGRNHRGPRRSRLGSHGLLLSDFEICCLGNFKDMTRENLEWMVSLCGASLVKEPQMFKHKDETTSLVVVQSDGKTDYAAMQKRYRALVVTREWVLDSVSSYKLQTFDSYLV